MSTLPKMSPTARVNGSAHNRLVEELSRIATLGGVGTRTATFSSGSVASYVKPTPQIRRVTPRTFWVSGGGGANAYVTAGVINNIAYAGGTLTAPSDGDSVYIDATISGVTVTAVTVAAGASVPADTSTNVYTLLATVAVTGSVATVTPLAWNYSQMQICAGQALWGGFGA